MSPVAVARVGAHHAAPQLKVIKKSLQDTVFAACGVLADAGRTTADIDAVMLSASHQSQSRIVVDGAARQR